MTDRELMQQVLEKLEFFAHMKSVSEDTARLIAALRERLAQPEQEPVAWVGEISEEAELMLEKPRFRAVPLYTRPQAREPLTDEQIAELMVGIWSCASIPPRERSHRLARAIEAAHGIGEKK